MAIKISQLDSGTIVNTSYVPFETNAGVTYKVTLEDFGAAITIPNITQITNRSHANLTSIGTNTHAQIDTHIANTSNPHSVTATQLGLGNVDNTSDATKNAATATLTNKTITSPSIYDPTITGSGATPGTLTINGASSGDEGAEIKLKNADGGTLVSIDRYLDTLRFFRNDADAGNSDVPFVNYGAGGKFLIGVNQGSPVSAVHIGATGGLGAVTIDEESGTPANPSQSNQVKIYCRGNKIIFQWNDAGTVRYKYLDLTGTGVTWVHSTTAPT